MDCAVKYDAAELKQRLWCMSDYVGIQQDVQR